ncbi:MAG: hypothetical protein O3C10_08615 [Chloroflexi bacterium]|nr:hypothetical protein [Chloroflexota bacterium]
MIDRPGTYEEKIAAPDWLRWALLGALALTISTVGLRIGAGHATGSGSIIPWFVTLLSVGAFLFVYLNFLTLRIRVSGGRFTIAYGVVRHSIHIDQIESIEHQKYRWTRYGGWGYRLGMHGRRAWSVPGVPEGVVVMLHESGKRREYFVSSLTPELLEAAITEGMPPVPPESG